MQTIIEKRLSALTGNINIIKSNDINPLIRGIAYDSRSVEEGFLFIALPGLHVDGHSFIDRAIAAGAAAVLYSDDSVIEQDGIAFIKTGNTRTAMAPAAAAFYDNPADRLTTIGVTGTDGKTSTVYNIDQLLELCGCKCGFVSTAACKTGSVIEKNPYRQSTPEAVEINMMLTRMLEAGKTHAVIESTSHGLSRKNNRLGGISFDAAVFTNLSHEHLEFHGTIEQYCDDKANLFRKLNNGSLADSRSEAPGFGVVNLDDENAQHFIDSAAEGSSGIRVFTCSLKDGAADFYADNINAGVSGSSFRITVGAEASKSGTSESVSTSIGLPGLFNIENVLEAFAVVYMLTGVQAEELAAMLPELAAVKGRMKVLNCGQPFTAIIDYAHTPGSFRRLFPDMREQTRGRLIAVFGSAGERDIEKRPEQGEIAAGYADILIITDEDPRGDNAQQILDEIAAGALGADRNKSDRQLTELKKGENLFLIQNRTEAIAKAFEIACEGDTVIMLGKGHEGSIIYADGPVPWDEEAAAVKLLKELVF